MTTTSRDDPPEGMKYVDDSRWAHIVPESLQIGENVRFDIPRFGENCVASDGASLRFESCGNNCTFGERSRLEELTVLEHDIRIGARTSVRSLCRIMHHVIIGDDVLIGRGVIIRPHVIVPSNWEIPGDCIVNPGPQGSPVVIMRQPSFHCNVTANRGY